MNAIGLLRGGRASAREVVFALLLALLLGTPRGVSAQDTSPNRTRLFFGPTAETLQAGDGYFQVFELFVSFVAYGAKDRLTLAAGTPLFFGSGTDRLFWLAPKLSVVSQDDFDFAIGTLALFATGDSDTAGILYGVGTWTGGDAAFTAGLGYGFVNGDLAARPAVMLGLDLAVGSGTSLITENYIFPGGGGVLAAGPRFYGGRFAFDLGLLAPFGVDDGGLILPLVNVVINF